MSTRQYVGRQEYMEKLDSWIKGVDGRGGT